MWRQKVTHQALEEGEAEYSIRDVWADNLEDEMGYIRELLEEYPYIAMACAIAGVFVVSLCFFFQDTEFPGVVARPVGNFRSSTDYHYQTLRCNVDLLKIIQLGLTFADAEGNYPLGTCTWQFNFKFNLKYAAFDSCDVYSFFARL